MPAFRDAGEYWVPSIITFPSDLFRGSSVFHPALIVFLRSVSVMSPMNFKTWHQKLSWSLITMIWIYLLVILITPTAISTDGFTTKIMPKSHLQAYSDAWSAFYHGSLTVPLLLVVMMNILLIFILKYYSDETNESEVVSKKKKALTRMTTAITIATLMCYLPIVIWTQYRIHLVKQNQAHLALNTTLNVSYEIDNCSVPKFYRNLDRITE